jgi:hypothetical protein
MGNLIPYLPRKEYPPPPRKRPVSFRSKLFKKTRNNNCGICMKKISVHRKCGECSFESCKTCIESWLRLSDVCPQCRRIGSWQNVEYTYIESDLESESMVFTGMIIGTIYSNAPTSVPMPTPSPAPMSAPMSTPSLREGLETTINEFLIQRTLVNIIVEQTGASREIATQILRENLSDSVFYGSDEDLLTDEEFD